MNQPEVQSEPTSSLPTVVDRCTQAFQAAHRAALAQNKSDYKAEQKAIIAYHRAMPHLAGEQDIHDFIACIANGILLGAIESKQSTILLYAAQVALSSLARQQKLQDPKREKAA